MIGILFATLREARPFLDRMGNEPLPDHPVSCFRVPSSTGRIGAVVAISGMGKVAAAVAAQILIRDLQVTRIINPGICGSLSSLREFKQGAIYAVSEAVEGDLFIPGGSVSYVPCSTEGGAEMETARLVTCDKPVFDTDRREALASLGDVTDMEGAAVARVARMYNIPCTLIKGVTDLADEEGRDALERNIDSVSTEIADILVMLLK